MFTNRTSYIETVYRASRGVLGLLVLWLWSTPLPAQAQQNVVVDDFESGVGAWTRNDKLKAGDPEGAATLVDVVATTPSPGGPAQILGKGAALFTFKAAQGSWASASRVVSGAQWAKIGAQRLTFYLNAGGAEEGVDLVLRGRYRSTDGSTHEEAFKLRQPVRLDLHQWRKVVIPLSAFKSDRGLLPARMSGIYLLQFVQTGTWDSRFFMVDQLAVEGTGTPLPQMTAEEPAPTAAPVARPVPANATKVSVDYLRTQGRILPSANVSVGAAYAGIGGSGTPAWNNPQFRQAMKTLKPRFMRIDAGTLSDLVDSSRPAFDFRRLQTLVRHARALSVEPIIALTNPREWGLDARGYAVFATLAARATMGSGMGGRYFELATGANNTNDAQAVAFYNRARAALKGINKNYRIGGNTVPSGRPNSLMPLLQGAQGIDFLTVQFYGALTGTPPDSTLMNAARDITSLRQAATLLDRSRWRDAPLYITQSNLNSARSFGDPAPGDGRTVQMISAAWWANFLGSASRVADQIFHNDAVNPEWGLLDEDARAYPAYYVLWLWNAYFPAGSTRVEAAVSRSNIFAVAANTATAHNLMLVNRSADEVAVQVSIRGFPVLRQARMRIFDDPLQVVRMVNLPKSPYQTVTLKPYAVAVVQFIEPPRRSSRSR